ncbi:cutinase family protein [Corynebacterium choanae]|uniref:Cutinase n=1 Tax=Corynebacterium choanae TaxID=1862358 RepID=A0A3G6J879_9CORY|nr:cutinase family protein [Corynebacterium choanae]AZA14109.1 Cutinase [Corynebacterium choanae]
MSLKQKLVALAAGIASVTTLTTAPAVAQPVTCPAAVIIAARGSGEPQAASLTFPIGRATTTGWEGGMIQRMLEQVDLRDTLVLGLDDNDYQASQVGIGSGTDVYESAVNGARSVVSRAKQFEDTTGCRPAYVVMGYSQGAAVVHLAELPMALSRRLVGSVYLGDPFLAPNDWARVGATWPTRGMVYNPVGGLDSTKLYRAEQTVNFCIPRDPVCDWPGNVESAQHDYDNHVRYFRLDGRDTAAEQETIARINAMLNTARQRRNAGTYDQSVTPREWAFISNR